MTIALLDGDILAYRCAAVSENDSEQIAIARLNDLIHQICKETMTEDTRTFLSCSTENNFRSKIYPFYKANRSQPRPKWLSTLKDHLSLVWNAERADDLEADDLLGIAMTELGDEGICVSIDKDLLQIPGNHYNFVKKEFIGILPSDGWYNFYYQLLMGDSTDNIPGCAGIGKVKAARALQYCEDEDDMFRVVQEKYEDNFTEMYLYGVLLWIKREKDKTWQPPTGLDLLSPEMVQRYESMTRTMMDQYMEHITQEQNEDGFL